MGTTASALFRDQYPLGKRTSGCFNKMGMATCGGDSTVRTETWT